MKFLFSLVAATLLGILASQLHAQQKIGYANFQALVAVQPEIKQVQQQLSVHENKLREQMSVKQSYFQGKMEEYNTKKQQSKLTAEQEEASLKELRTLDEEVKKFAENSQNDLVKKQEELVGPIVTKVRKAIDDVATTEGYSYVLNSAAGDAGSLLLHSPKSDDITDKVAAKLGVTIPKEGDATTTTSTTPKPGTTTTPK